ncbi:acyltransferase family protein [Calothrix sp. FACHB-1219]|uniref:lysophospholipid acyltransferase family protein n=1 Tax=unclassified Calothrix TaxID=2619626 RepID=UPI00168750BD|nr:MULTISPECIES: lysophospholipid acyltransferase family protein [unclassified Calothrix]MBD2207761.1 acyltransferase family protein [Calothrix sp. FACHB-168]MBD2222336.1 acyltransferase family protein [Calothrix sp. FACHB-1219]
MSETQHHLDTKLGWSLDRRDPRFIESIMPILGWFYDHYFRVQTSGWEHVSPQEKVLFVGSHNGGLAAPDMLMMMYDWFRRFGVEQPVYGLMHPTVWEVTPPIAELAAKGGAIIAHPKMAYAALRSGASVLVYPGGAEDVFRPYSLRNKIYFAGRQGFIKLALREQVPIVPVISSGAHDTLIVLTDCYNILQQLHKLGMPWLLGVDPVVFPIYLGLPWGLSIGPLPNIPFPVTIHTRICPPIKFEHYGREAASDRNYVNACYELVVNQMQQELDELVKQTHQS